MPTEGIIKQCSIVLTRGCNLRCNFCYVKRAGYVEDDRIDYDDLKSIVDFCCANLFSLGIVFSIKL